MSDRRPIAPRTEKPISSTRNTRKPTSTVIIDGTGFALDANGNPSWQTLKSACTQMTSSPAAIVVEASFGHRLRGKDRNSYDKAVSSGQVISPPAGTIGGITAFLTKVASAAKVTLVCAPTHRRPIPATTLLVPTGRIGAWNPLT